MKTKTNLLGFTNINDAEAAIMFRSIISTGLDKDTAMDDMELLDKLLTTQKTYSILNKKRGLKKQLSAIIENHIGVK